jgi:hypothetical protein
MSDDDGGGFVEGLDDTGLSLTWRSMLYAPISAGEAERP